MADKKSILTTSGAQRLRDELNDLKVNKLTEVADKIKEARAQGDLSENAEYDAAKNEQAGIVNRITELQEILENAEIVEEDGDTSRVFIGAIVTVLDMEEDEEEEIKIVGSTEANSLQNKISNESPMGQALIGSQVGDVITVSAPGGEFSYKVLNIRKQ